MYKFLILLFLVSIAITLALRWWFGSRVLISFRERLCRCDLSQWTPALDTNTLRRAEQSAIHYGQEIRQQALSSWKTEHPPSAATWRNSRTFSAIVPPLSLILALFAQLAGKVPFAGALAILFGSISLSCIFCLLTLSSELAAIQRATQTIRQKKIFPSTEDSAAVTRCAFAHAWDAAIPPILRKLFP